ncbi:JAB domain-containing protein [Shewanella phaeophyticola]|uniref:JAB domain-containing protein n=1 Tax=Shewanella phaeophyticola TaxID=2978345 RepID=A0ABT2NXZ9_9GAMM|nr:JAB domain-containing protein [Shewanella sp. KJ10-1]MCT8985276.1 JAB domain-containing protein [Shewanella sp. KJ10-1]
MALIREINVKYQFRESQCELAEKTLLRPEDAAKVFDYLKYETKEVFIVANLTTQRAINCVEVVATGCINSISMRPSEVLRTAVILNMPGIILVHNHPSGDPTPSTSDLNFTHKVIECAKVLNIEVIDHVIIGLNRFTSLRQTQPELF